MSPLAKVTSSSPTGSSSLTTTVKVVAEGTTRATGSTSTSTSPVRRPINSDTLSTTTTGTVIARLPSFLAAILGIRLAARISHPMEFHSYTSKRTTTSYGHGPETMNAISKRSSTTTGTTA